MLVSWNWLSNYIDLTMDREELEQRLSLSGLNHEGTESLDDDVVIDLEVTSNRGDCLGHLGVAREIGVLYGLKVKTPQPRMDDCGEPIGESLSVRNEYPEACPRYTARVIRGVQVGPSPDWLVRSLRAVGIAAVNNVVDATNYVMLECGQPLHAFDHAKVSDRQIVVRRAREKESIEAIDHRSYPLKRSMCVIADASEATAVAGVMGGAKSEVDESTRDLVIEAAIFTPLMVRQTARTLKLHSPSSYRFERRVDPVGVDWASRRVCQLIVELAGGEVAGGSIDTSPEIPERKPIVLRSGELKRILGIEIGGAEVTRILTELGCTASGSGPQGRAAYIPPSWRHDITREADLIEEVARIHGYDKIPEDAPIPVAPSAKRPFDSAIERVRLVLTAAGLSEAMTPSVVTEKLDESLSPWTDQPALETQTAMLEGARRLRRSLLPSLIQGRANNWSASGLNADLFEIAHTYLPHDQADGLPREHYSLGLVCGKEFFDVKGMLEVLVERLGVGHRVSVEAFSCDGFIRGGSVRLELGDQLLGSLGIVDPTLLKQWKLPEGVVAAELSLPVLLEQAHLVPQQQLVSSFPSVQRDLNFVLAESVRWSQLEQVVRSAGGDELARVTYRETYRDPEKDGADRKRLLMTVELQRHDATLSGEEADRRINRIVDACHRELGTEWVS
jgi:phenylalanyl-tRNA synthetase beta chain